MADALALLRRESRRFPSVHPLTLHLTRTLEREFLPRSRRHPLVAALTLACALSAPEMASKLLIERYSLGLAGYVFAVSVSSMFAAVVIVGRYLGLVGAPGIWPATWVCAAIGGAAGAPIAAGCRDLLARSVGVGAVSSLSELVLITAGGGVVGFVVAATVTAGARALNRRRLQR